uniref:BTB domain-containing protein n=1 Tax=Rhizophagus irregularis (strain DAOM 181602 / DAOM 197198 / MUCL 43194) TaxID=747089 RepID=U9UES3_RHIID
MNKLSQNYIEILEDNEYYDVTIEVGGEPNWSLAQNQNLVPKPDTWTDDDFRMIENTLQNCLPLIRFYSLSSKEFLHKVRSYRKLFKQQLYEKLLNSYMDPDIEPNDDSVLLPRNIIIDEVNDITIVNLNIISIISRWIDNKVDFNNKCSYLGELHLPYKFELLLRGNRDGFDPNKFHELCDNKSNTVTFIKIKGTGEILDEIKDSIVSHIKNMDKALYYSNYYGPSFGDPDLKLSYSGWSLSQNYIGILEDNEYYDVTIEAGEDPNVKIFRAHLIILCHRSPFLRRALASKKKNDNNNLTHIKLSNISPEIFQIILK